MRQFEFIKRSYAAILSSIGGILIIAGLIMILPLFILPAFPHEQSLAIYFLLPAIFMTLIGIYLRKRFNAVANLCLTIEEGGVIVVIGWMIVIFFSALPFIAISGLSFSGAIFESVSGWTTTGLSVVNVETSSHLILFWRSLIQLAGGAGLAIIMMSALVGPAGSGISNAEGRGDQLLPHVKSSARMVMIIYSSYAILGTVAYRLAGMTLFDAVNHSFAAVSTGGFSTRVESIGFWNSVSIEAITIPLMILGNLSFVTAWHFLLGEFKTVYRNGEVRFFCLLAPVAAALIFFLSCQAIYPTIEKSLRVAIFETVSALTTTGFSTVSYSNWSSSGILLMSLLMIIGGGSCSTAGGIKQLRVYFACKSIAWEIKRLIMPKAAVIEFSVWEGKRETWINDGRLRQIAIFIFIYLITYLLGVLLLCACGFSLSDSIFEFASALGTAGLSVGVTSASMPLVAIWAESIAMFLGRLEFIIVITSFLKIIMDLASLREKTGKT